jgi:hypothetical protein
VRLFNSRSRRQIDDQVATVTIPGLRLIFRQCLERLIPTDDTGSMALLDAVKIYHRILPEEEGEYSSALMTAYKDFALTRSIKCNAIRSCFLYFIVPQITALAQPTPALTLPAYCLFCIQIPSGFTSSSAVACQRLDLLWQTKNQSLVSLFEEILSPDRYHMHRSFRLTSLGRLRSQIFRRSDNLIG